MNIKLKPVTKLIVAGAVLALSGLLFAYTLKDSSAQAADTYNLTWNATDVLAVNTSTGENGTDYGTASIGVSAWRVTGTVAGAKITETWTAPALDGARVNTNHQDGCTFQMSNTVASKYLTACFVQQDDLGGPRHEFYEFITRAPGELGKVENLNGKNEGGGQFQEANTCINSPRNSAEDECIVATGAYGFLHLYEPGKSARGRILGGGMMMPLEWQVSGTIE